MGGAVSIDNNKNSRLNLPVQAEVFIEVNERVSIPLAIAAIHECKLSISIYHT